MGIENIPFRNLTSKQRMIARVKGSRILKSVPWPGLDFTSTVQKRSAIRLLTISMPTPRPEMSVIFSAVLKPGCQMYSMIC